MSVTDQSVENNRAYAASFSGPLPMPPSRHVAVVACMDARLDVYRLLGLAEGEAHVIRNAGGVVTDDEIRSLAIQCAWGGGSTPLRRHSGGLPDRLIGPNGSTGLPHFPVPSLEHQAHRGYPPPSSVLRTSH